MTVHEKLDTLLNRDKISLFSATVKTTAKDWSGANGYTDLSFVLPKNIQIIFSNTSCTVNGVSVASPFITTEEENTVVFSQSHAYSNGTNPVSYYFQLLG